MLEPTQSRQFLLPERCLPSFVRNIPRTTPTRDETHECAKCGNEHLTSQTELTLRLGLPKGQQSIQLNALIATENDITEARCQNGACDRMMNNTGQVIQPGPYLRIHLARYDDGGMRNHTLVTFLITEFAFGAVTFDLLAVIDHFGETGSRHYTCNVKLERGGRCSTTLLYAVHEPTYASTTHMA